MRLDKNILPTRFRFATMTHAEVDKLKNVKNIIRKGRVASIDKERVKFESGEEMTMPEDTVVVDCARNTTKFTQDKKVFDGDKINLQFIMLPPSGSPQCKLYFLSNITFNRYEYGNYSWS